MEAQNTTQTVDTNSIGSTPTYTPVQGTSNDQSNTINIVAISGFVLSIFNLCSWLLPICGCPMSLIGIGLSAFGLKSEKYKTFAIIGLVISSLAFIATIINGILGGIIALNEGL
jgi:hypothetical protein